VVDKKGRRILCTQGCEGKRHDFQLFKDSKVRFRKGTVSLEDSGYQGIEEIHSNALTPKKKSKNRPLTKQQKRYNKMLSSERVGVENTIGWLKRFHILTDRYRNRRKRFGLRFNLIAGIYNYEL
jgi:IS5 family transposase